MCATVNKYERKIQKLQKVIYPQISDLIEEIKCYIDVYNYDGLEENVSMLQREFSSLISVEDKLVFPVILSVFKNDFDFKYFPNIAELLHFTSAKNAKIKIYLSNIEKIIIIKEVQVIGDFEKDILRLIQMFSEVYFPAKQRWNALLQMLTPESITCENRKNNTCKCGTHANEKEETHHHHH